MKFKPSLKWKPKRIKRRTLVDKLDEIVSLYIRKRDGKCVQCGSTDRLTNGHLFPGRYQPLTWDIRTDGICHTQCWPHNYKHVYHQADYYEWYIRKFGIERFLALKREYYGGTGKLSDKQLKTLYISVKEKYEKLP